MLVNSIVNFTTPDLAKGIKIPSPATGQVLNITELLGSLNSLELVGQGIAIKLDKGSIFSPVNGKVVDIRPDLGRISIVTRNNLTFCMQLAGDYGKLHGLGLKLNTKLNDTVTVGQPIADLNLYKLNQMLGETTLYFLLINTKIIKNIDVKHKHLQAIKDTAFSLIPYIKKK